MPRLFLCVPRSLPLLLLLEGWAQPQARAAPTASRRVTHAELSPSITLGTAETSDLNEAGGRRLTFGAGVIWVFSEGCSFGRSVDSHSTSGVRASAVAFVVFSARAMCSKLKFT